MIFGGKAFQDPEFRTLEEAVYEVKYNGTAYQGRDVARVAEWRRLKDLPSFKKATDGKPNVRLFEDGVRAADINQGSVGDCWLLSSLACLATRAGAVENLFLTSEYNEEGRYQLRLWDKQIRQYRDITIDDNIPVWRQGGQPCFARPTGNEAWVLLLEKAMAKYVGNYFFLDGGMASWALETLTGHYTCVFLLEQKFGPNRGAGPEQSKWQWLRAELSPKPADRVVAFGARASPLNRAALYMYDGSDASKFYSHEEVFMAIVYHLAIGNLVAAATVGTDDEQAVDGVVRAHAYTVMSARPVTTKEGVKLMMVQVRNPHGSGGIEWTGNWSDQSGLWSKQPEVAQALEYTPSDFAGAKASATDGLFWMEWADFLQYFKEVTFCCKNGFDYVEDQAAGWVEVFNDPTFPHDHRSLGDYKFILNGVPKTGSLLEEVIKWLRLKEIAAPEQFRRGTRGLKLFAGGGTHPDDIDGGSTGLMVAVACLANKPGAIEEMFVSGQDYRPDGAYQVRLYEPKTGEATIAPIDDWIPCYNNNPITKTKILGSEVWVLLLEKAVARLVESYSKVSMWGVQVCWALACLTGEYTCLLMWQEDKKKWRRMELVFVEKQPAQYRAEWAADDLSLIANDDVFAMISTQLLLGCLMAAETDKQVAPPETTGLAKGRSYSILDARSVQAGGRPGSRVLRLVKLRDPARQNEWQGDWCDSSMMWDQYPAVAETLGHKRRDPASGTDTERSDGSFWMPYEDFLQYFRLVTMCGNSLRGNKKPWAASQLDLDTAAWRLAEARRQQKLRAEQEALEEAQHLEVRKKAMDRANAPQGLAAGKVFAKAALAAAATDPKRDKPLLPPKKAVSAASAGAGASAAAVGGVVAGATAAGASPTAGQGGGEGVAAGGAAGAASSKPAVVVVESHGCKGCSVM